MLLQGLLASLERQARQAAIVLAFEQSGPRDHKRRHPRGLRTTQVQQRRIGVWTGLHTIHVEQQRVRAVQAHGVALVCQGDGYLQG